MVNKAQLVRVTTHRGKVYVGYITKRTRVETRIELVGGGFTIEPNFGIKSIEKA